MGIPPLIMFHILQGVSDGQIPEEGESKHPVNKGYMQDLTVSRFGFHAEMVDKARVDELFGHLSPALSPLLDGVA
jgi:hypothetical protein